MRGVVKTNLSEIPTTSDVGKTQTAQYKKFRALRSIGAKNVVVVVVLVFAFAAILLVVMMKYSKLTVFYIYVLYTR